MSGISELLLKSITSIPKHDKWDYGKALAVPVGIGLAAIFDKYLFVDRESKDSGIIFAVLISTAVINYGHLVIQQFWFNFWLSKNKKQDEVEKLKNDVIEKNEQLKSVRFELEKAYQEMRNKKKTFEDTTQDQELIVERSAKDLEEADSKMKEHINKYNDSINVFNHEINKSKNYFLRREVKQSLDLEEPKLEYVHAEVEKDVKNISVEISLIKNKKQNLEEDKKTLNIELKKLKETVATDSENYEKHKIEADSFLDREKSHNESLEKYSKLMGDKEPVKPSHISKDEAITNFIDCNSKIESLTRSSGAISTNNFLNDVNDSYVNSLTINQLKDLDGVISNQLLKEKSDEIFYYTELENKFAELRKAITNEINNIPLKAIRWVSELKSRIDILQSEKNSKKSILNTSQENEKIEHYYDCLIKFISNSLLSLIISIFELSDLQDKKNNPLIFPVIFKSWSNEMAQYSKIQIENTVIPKISIECTSIIEGLLQTSNALKKVKLIYSDKDLLSNLINGQEVDTLEVFLIKNIVQGEYNNFIKALKDYKRFKSSLVVYKNKFTLIKDKIKMKEENLSMLREELPKLKQKQEEEIQKFEKEFNDYSIKNSNYGFYKEFIEGLKKEWDSKINKHNSITIEKEKTDLNEKRKKVEELEKSLKDILDTIKDEEQNLSLHESKFTEAGNIFEKLKDALTNQTVFFKARTFYNEKKRIKDEESEKLMNSKGNSDDTYDNKKIDLKRLKEISNDNYFNSKSSKLNFKNTLINQERLILFELNETKTSKGKSLYKIKDFFSNDKTKNRSEFLSLVYTINEQRYKIALLQSFFSFDCFSLIKSEISSNTLNSNKVRCDFLLFRLQRSKFFMEHQVASSDFKSGAIEIIISTFENELQLVVDYFKSKEKINRPKASKKALFAILDLILDKLLFKIAHPIINKKNINEENNSCVKIINQLLLDINKYLSDFDDDSNKFVTKIKKKLFDDAEDFERSDEGTKFSGFYNTLIHIGKGENKLNDRDNYDFPEIVEKCELFCAKLKLLVHLGKKPFLENDEYKNKYVKYREDKNVYKSKKQEFLYSIESKEYEYIRAKKYRKFPQVKINESWMSYIEKLVPLIERFSYFLPALVTYGFIAPLPLTGRVAQNILAISTFSNLFVRFMTPHYSTFSKLNQI